MEISNNLLAAYAEGNVSESERETVRQYLTHHPDLLETVMIMMDDDFDIQLDDYNERVQSHSFDEELDALLDEIESVEPEADNPSANKLPFMSYAAKNVVDNLCAVRCEGYALRALGVDVSDKELEREAEDNGWLEPEGTPLHRIGLLSEKHGLSAIRKYNCSIEQLIRAVIKGDIVIATIDNTELNQSIEEAKRNDLQNGENPNHTVIVKSIDLQNKTITIIDSGIPNLLRTYPMDVFQNAWNDSANYIIILSKQHNYEQLPEFKKKHNELMDVNTIKIVKKQGWDIQKMK